MALAWGCESILRIITSIINTMTLSIVNAAMASLRDRSRKIREFWGCLKEPNGVDGRYARNVTPILDNDTTAGWVQVAIKIRNPFLVSVIYHGEQVDTTSGAQPCIRCGRSYLSLDAIIPPPAEDLIYDIGEKLDDDGETRHPSPSSVAITNSGFQMSERTLQR
jgi:hypothetical protein